MKKWIWILIVSSLFASDLKDPHKTHYPLISGDTFRSIAHHIFDEAFRDFNASDVATGEIVFVAMSRLPAFLKFYLPDLKSKFILVTSNGSGTIDERYRSVFENPYLTAWFGRNITFLHPKAHLIPLGICQYRHPNHTKMLGTLKKMHEDLSMDLFFCPKPIHTYLNIDPRNHASRLPVMDYFATQSYCKIESKKPFKEFLEDLTEARFVLSPRGVNIDCFRTWEALYAGSIPVVESWGIDPVYDDLPILIVKDLTKVTKDDLDEAFESMKTKSFNLDKLHADYWFEKIEEARTECFH